MRVAEYEVPDRDGDGNRAQPIEVVYVLWLRGHFHHRNDRVGRRETLFEPVLTLKQKLPSLDALRRLGEVPQATTAVKSKPAAKARKTQRAATARPAARRRRA